MAPMVTGTDRSTTASTPPKSYLSGTLKRDRGDGAGGAAGRSAAPLGTSRGVAAAFRAHDVVATPFAPSSVQAQTRRSVLTRGLMRTKLGWRSWDRQCGMPLRFLHLSSSGDAPTFRGRVYERSPATG